MSKIYKYIKKINKKYTKTYKNKILYHLNENNIMDNNNDNIHQYGGIGNLDELFEYLKKRINTNKQTIKKYMVILYGPTGSGKTLSRKIACYYIKKLFGETMSYTDLESTFVDTGVDEITYEKKNEISNKTVKELLKENLLEKTKNKYIQIDKNIISEFINKLTGDEFNDIVDSSFKIYKNNRADAESEAMLYIGSAFKRNIFMEFASFTESYFDNIINGFCKFYGYIPIIIYPFVNDAQILFARTLKRGMDEGRFINCTGNYGISKMIEKDLEDYPKILPMLHKLDHYLFIMYDANINQEDYNKYNNYNFVTFDNNIMDIQYKIKNTDNNKIVTEEYKKKITNFENLTKINTTCPIFKNK